MKNKVLPQFTFFKIVSLLNYIVWIIIISVFIFLIKISIIITLIVFLFFVLLISLIRRKCKCCLKIKNFILIKNDDKKYGHYTSQEILNLVNSVSKKMGIKEPKRVYLYHSKLPNAFVIGCPILYPEYRNCLFIFSNILYILNINELTAIIGHELAHVKERHKIFPIILLLGGKNAFKTLRINEHIADYYSAKMNGILPMVNGLIKAYSRAQIFEDILKHLDYFRKIYKISEDIFPYFISLSEKFIPHTLEVDKPISYYASLIVQEYIMQRSGSIKTVAKTIVKNIDQSVKELKDENEWRTKYEKIDWKFYDAHIKDLWIDEIELRKIYRKLKSNSKCRLFIGSSKDYEKEETHPYIENRIIFLVESLGVELFWASTELREVWGM